MATVCVLLGEGFNEIMNSLRPSFLVLLSHLFLAFMFSGGAILSVHCRQCIITGFPHIINYGHSTHKTPKGWGATPSGSTAGRGGPPVGCVQFIEAPRGSPS
jgi:hypothetical protein